MNPRYFFLPRERAVTSGVEPRRCDYARAAAAWLLVAFACLAVPIPALAAEAAVHQKFEAAYSRLAAPESAPLNLTAPAVSETPDTSVDYDDDDDAAIRIHSEWVPTPPRLLILDLPTLLVSPVILTVDCLLRGPPAATALQS